jgi:hypothetical protein
MAIRPSVKTGTKRQILTTSDAGPDAAVIVEGFGFINAVNDGNLNRLWLTNLVLHHSAPPPKTGGSRNT